MWVSFETSNKVSATMQTLFGEPKIGHGGIKWSEALETLVIRYPGLVIGQQRSTTASHWLAGPHPPPSISPRAQNVHERLLNALCQQDEQDRLQPQQQQQSAATSFPWPRTALQQQQQQQQQSVKQEQHEQQQSVKQEQHEQQDADWQPGWSHDDDTWSQRSDWWGQTQPATLPVPAWMGSGAWTSGVSWASAQGGVAHSQGQTGTAHGGGVAPNQGQTGTAHGGGVALNQGQTGTAHGGVAPNQGQTGTALGGVAPNQGQTGTALGGGVAPSQGQTGGGGGGDNNGGQWPWYESMADTLGDVPSNGGGGGNAGGGQTDQDLMGLPPATPTAYTECVTCQAMGVHSLAAWQCPFTKCAACCRAEHGTACPRHNSEYASFVRMQSRFERAQRIRGGAGRWNDGGWNGW